MQQRRGRSACRQTSSGTYPLSRSDSARHAIRPRARLGGVLRRVRGVRVLDRSPKRICISGENLADSSRFSLNCYPSVTRWSIFVAGPQASIDQLRPDLLRSNGLWSTSRFLPTALHPGMQVRSPGSAGWFVSGGGLLYQLTRMPEWGGSRVISRMAAEVLFERLGCCREQSEFGERPSRGKSGFAWGTWGPSEGVRNQRE